ncbi:MAG: NAD(P)-dependent oxidoreductase [Nitrososphaeraceae archaeon]|jgi:3-hydroxyisobutyrate dehydrogenase-like beta-hydroxyacid dehydrogenase|nr:NAD(P)-dependent oxidoreductase [Nitrososphaeraceae archaeon]MDW0169665.1 NAD(P)-dependent oxidoreductase [Nitrososphaeraceae archaeon]MDW0170975.1 NAD(P)-dependent oxidoreductase [Nitrososphaeraceae archaeon]MDW0173735.1 NAD(P)-dependent oxidoreductase [Nitrososphaeraceae archaeon]MDW0178376.1 NAD(P)-dependent oxidoreductase [Nitrososphaeraceae archaeon]
MNIGIIGTGLMGSAIAERLIERGFTVYVHNRTKQRSDALVRKGGIRIGNPSELGKKCNYVIISVTDGNAVKEILFGNNGLINSNNNQLSIIDTSTVLPEDSIYCANLMKRKGYAMIQAPIMGGPDATRKGDVISIVSGDKKIMEKCRRILTNFSKKIFYAGHRDGAANYLKLGLNLNIALIAISLSESIIFIKKSKTDPTVFLDILNSTYFKTGLSEIKGPKMIRNNFEPKFFLKNMLKDVQLLNECAKRNNASLSFSSLAEQYFRMAANRGYSELDYTAILKLFGEFNNLKSYTN